MRHHTRTGGILSIISGAFSMVYLLCLSWFAVITHSVFGYVDTETLIDTPAVFDMVDIITIVITVIIIIIGILAIIGGIFSVKKRRWSLALTGAIAGTILFFPTGITAVIFTTLGRNEFIITKSEVISPSIPTVEE